MQSMNKKEWKLLELQITQTRHPKVLQADRQTDVETGGQSRPITRPAKAMQIKRKNSSKKYILLFVKIREISDY